MNTTKQLASVSNFSNDTKEFDPRFYIINRWTFLMKQSFEARKFLELAEQKFMVHPQSSLEELLTQQALFRSAILSYAKCFSDSGPDRSSLDKKKVYIGKPSLLPIHERMMSIRNKFAAHNDISGLDDAVIDVQETADEFSIRNLYAIANPLNEYDNYRKCFGVLDEFIIININKSMDSLQRKLGKKVVNMNNKVKS